VPRTSRSSRPLVALAALGPLFLLAACGGGAQAEGSPTSGDVVKITLTDDGCTAEPSSVAAGSATFDVTNDGASAVTEAELVDAGGRILGERENLTPGLKSSFSLEVEPGTYSIQCPNAATELTPFTVTGATASATGTADPLLAAASTGYEAYVGDQVAQLVPATQAFAAAVEAGDVDGAKALYGPARAPYERIEPVAESFGDLDPAIDARIADVADPSTWSGFHRIEQALWVDGSTAGMAPVAQQLVADVTELQTLTASVTFQPAELANGASALLDEVAKSKVTGEEEAYSHLDLLDFAANVEGARKAFDLLTPVLTATDPQLVTTITQRFDDVTTGLAPFQRGDSWAPYTELSAEQVRRLATAVDALAEPLSTVSGEVVAGGGK